MTNSPRPTGPDVPDAEHEGERCSPPSPLRRCSSRRARQMVRRASRPPPLRHRHPPTRLSPWPPRPPRHRDAGGDRQPVSVRRGHLQGRLLPDPAQLLGRLHRGGAESQQRHRQLGVRRERRLPVLELDGVVPVRHQRCAGVQVLRHRAPPRRRVHEPLRRRQPDPGVATELPHLLHAEHDTAWRRVEHAVGRQERRGAAGRRQHPGVSIVSRSYWSFGNDGLGDYDRFGYGGPTEHAVSDDHRVPHGRHHRRAHRHPGRRLRRAEPAAPEVWYDRANERADRSPSRTRPYRRSRSSATCPSSWCRPGSFSGTLGKEFPPSPVPNEVQFYRNVASNGAVRRRAVGTGEGQPAGRLRRVRDGEPPNDVVSLVHIPQVPSFPDYTGATAETLNQSRRLRGAVLQRGHLRGDQAARRLWHAAELADRQHPDRQERTTAAPRLCSTRSRPRRSRSTRSPRSSRPTAGTCSRAASRPPSPRTCCDPREGPEPNWENALSANDVTQGAPCPQSHNPSLPLPQIRPARSHPAQRHGPHRTGRRELQHRRVPVRRLPDRLPEPPEGAGQQWSATGDWPTQKAP